MIKRAPAAYLAIACLLALIGFVQSWSVALVILNLCLVSAIMSLGLNIQWGYAGIFNAGGVAWAALGGLACVLVAQPPVAAAWQAGGPRLLLAATAVAVTVALAVLCHRLLQGRRMRTVAILAAAAAGYFTVRHLYGPAADAIEAVEPSKTGYLGGLGLPILLAWPAGGLLAAAAAWLIARIALGLRSDYLAIATLGIAEIVISVIKHEDWLTRGIKNVTGLPRPVPYEIALQEDPGFVAKVQRWTELFASGPVSDEALRQAVIQASSLVVKLCYTGLFAAVLVIVAILAERALRSPWGRMMRAIRDNEEAAAAVGKDIVFRRRQAFILGSAVIGIAGAMLVTLDGQFTPASYQPLRFTFLVWVMVILGGSGNNHGAIIGGCLVWLLWIQVEPTALWLMRLLTAGLADTDPVRQHLISSAPHVRTLLMGVILILVLRFWPRGLIPETVAAVAAPTGESQDEPSEGSRKEPVS